MDIQPRLLSRTTWSDDRPWIGPGGDHGIRSNKTITLDLALFGPNANEVQTITLGTPTVPATAGTFTLTFGGETTAPIAFNAPTAAIQAALEALSNIDVGDVAVAGGPLPGTPATVTFVGRYAARDMPLLGIAGQGGLVVAIATTTPGAGNRTADGFLLSGIPLGLVTATGLYGPQADAAADGRQTLRGFLYEMTKTVAGQTRAPAPLYRHGVVILANLPVAVSAAAQAQLPQVYFD